MAFTAPHEASVVTVANREEANTPKRTSLPSMFGTGARMGAGTEAAAGAGADAEGEPEVAATAWAMAGVPRYSKWAVSSAPARNTAAITPHTVQA